MFRAITMMLLLIIAIGCGAAPQNLDGVYTVTGTITDQGKTKSYSGKVQITEDPTKEDIYMLVWVTDEAPDKTAAVGTGYLHGDMLVVIISAHGIIELASYKRQGNTLTGHWIIPGVGGIMDEDLKKTDEEPFAVIGEPKAEPAKTDGIRL